jgi:hypothetical protein
MNEVVHPNKTMSNKVSLTWIKSSPDAEFETTLNAIVNGMTDNASLPNPLPTLAAVTAAGDTFITALAAAKDGGKLETAIKNGARDNVEGMMRKWGQYIDDTAQGDLEVLLSSKFPLQKPRLPVGIQPAPANLRLIPGKVSGSSTARCDRAAHRVMYEWQTATGETAGPWENEPPTLSASATFGGYEPGTWLHVRVRSRVTAGAGDWSNVIKIMVV